MTHTTTMGEVLLDDLVCAGLYRIQHIIAEGTTGHLFRARRIPDGRAVVLKCGSSANEMARTSLRAEADALSALEHPSIVRFLEHREGRDVAFLAMEALEGTDLATRMHAERVTRGEALSWLRELAAALDHVHARGLVHRDVKPPNVMIVPSARRRTRAVLVDFGLASPQRVGRTRSRFLCGTPAYMAPEQALGLEGQIGPATDRYALAAVALELITGQRPYPNASVPELIAMVIERAPRRPSELGSFGPRVDAVFARALARDPERRFESCAAFVEALELVLPRATAAHPRVSRARPDTRPATVRAKAA